MNNNLFFKGLRNSIDSAIGENFNADQSRSVLSKKEKIIIILLISGYFLTTFNFLILYFHQPQGYIIDIYSALPPFFFLSLITCYTLGSATLFYGEGAARKLGILLLMITFSMVLIIPYMLGYYSMGRADDMSYIGEYIQISNSGAIAGWDIYPASHIIGAILSIETGLDPHIVSFVIPFFFSFFFVGGLFLCCRLFLKDQIFENIAIPSSIIFYLGDYYFLNVPHALFFAVMPLFIFILFSFIKKQNFSTIVLALPLTFLAPFMHPFIFLFVILLFLALMVFSRILKIFVDINYRQTSRLFIIILIGFVTWFIYSSNLMRSLRANYLLYLRKTTESVFMETTDKLARINIDIYKILKLLLVYYGRYVIPFFIIITALVIIYLKRDIISKKLKNLVVFWGFFYIFFIFIELVLFLNPIISHQPDRLTNLNFMVYAQLPLFVLSLYIIFIQLKSKDIGILFILLILSSTWSLSLFGAFTSPNIFAPNEAIANNEIQGMKWFYETRTTDYVLTPITQIRRFHDLLADSSVDQMIYVSDHFGYQSGKIRLVTNAEDYFILLTIDELIYQKVPGYMDVGRYNADDFRRFRNDFSINKIYDDLNIEIYKGNGRSGFL